MAERRLEVKQAEGRGNALRAWTELRSPLRVTFNIIVLTVSKFLPLKLKNTVLRRLGAEVGAGASVALGVMLDVFYPEKISIGKNTTIGYGATILAHETTQNEFRAGEVAIGENVLIGANTTVLPGVKIGDGAKVAAGSLVNRDVEEGEFIGGVPVQSIDSEADES